MQRAISSVLELLEAFYQAVHHQVAAFSLYKHGFAPNLWKEIVDVEILKKAGVYDIEKMRTITLMHSDFNMNNKKLGKEIMKRAVEYNTIAPEQYGSRPGHQAITVGWNKRLTMDYSSRLLRLPIALSSIDAMSCYNRIEHAPASLAM